MTQQQSYAFRNARPRAGRMLPSEHFIQRGPFVIALSVNK